MMLIELNTRYRLADDQIVKIKTKITTWGMNKFFCPSKTGWWDDQGCYLDKVNGSIVRIPDFDIIDEDSALRRISVPKDSEDAELYASGHYFRWVPLEEAKRIGKEGYEKHLSKKRSAPKTKPKKAFTQILSDGGWVRITHDQSRRVVNIDTSADVTLLNISV